MIKNQAEANPKDMASPVVCAHCGKVYDLQRVQVIHRYGDCTLFRTPCCGKQADDRTWKGLPDFTKWTPGSYKCDLMGNNY